MRINQNDITDPTITVKFRMGTRDCTVLKDMLRGKATSRYEKRVAEIVIRELEKHGV